MLLLDFVRDSGPLIDPSLISNEKNSLGLHKASPRYPDSTGDSWPFDMASAFLEPILH